MLKLVTNPAGTIDPTATLRNILSPNTIRVKDLKFDTHMKDIFVLVVKRFEVVCTSNLETAHNLMSLGWICSPLTYSAYPRAWLGIGLNHVNLCGVVVEHLAVMPGVLSSSLAGVSSFSKKNILTLLVPGRGRIGPRTSKTLITQNHLIGTSWNFMTF